MKELKEAQMGMIAILTVMLVSITRRLPTRRLSSGITTTLALAGIVLLVAAGGASANCIGDITSTVFGPGSMVTESCTFNANMVCPAGAPGLYVGAAGITIDGAGYKMTGARDATACSASILYGGGIPPSENTPAMHSGIANNGNWNDVEITDLEIEGFCTGIALGSAAATDVDFNKVTNCSIHSCGDPGFITHGIHMVQTNNCNIKCNSIHDIDGSGFGCSGGGNGIFMYGNMGTFDGWYNSFTCNDLSHNTKSGFFMKHQCMHNYLGNNHAVWNGEGGIVPMCMKSDYNTYDRNNLSYNYKWGFMTRGTGNDILNNTMIGNGRDGISPGISIADHGGNVVNDNCVCGSGGMDIAVNGFATCNDNTCDTHDDGANCCPWNCDNLVSVYYDFDEDVSYSGLFGPCCNLLDVGAGNNPGLFNESGASTHCDGSFCIYPDPGDDLNDCGPSAPAAQPYYCDFDGDGYFNADSSGTAEELPSGCQWAQGDDCDDNNAAINPGAAENCTDGIDNDCDGLVDGADPDCFPNKVYFDPEDIRLPKQGDTTNVSIWIDASEALSGGLVVFDYTCCCANVTAYYPNTTNWNQINNANIGTCGTVTIGFSGDTEPGPGLVHIGDFTIECCGASYCETDLVWNTTIQPGSPPKMPGIGNLNGDLIPVDWNDGTFKCNIPDLRVTMVKATEILPSTTPSTYSVDCTVTNVGDVDASASHVNLAVDDPPTLTLTKPVGILTSGASETVTFGPITLSGTVDELLVCADCNNEVVETDETNNCMTGRYPGEVVISIQPVDTFVQPQDQFDVKVYVDTKGIDVYAVQYSLTYNTSVVRAETQNKDTFLGSISETMVIVNEIDQPHGEAFYAESRKVPGTVNVSDNITNVHFIAIGVRGDTTALTLDDIIISDENGVAIAYTIGNGTVEITTNTPPVANGTSKHRINNVAQKYQCISTLCSCSYDLDYPGKGGNISYIRWAFGDGQYGTSEGLPIENCTCKEHKYESWQWDPLGDPNGDYVPFDVQLDVMDDGCPEITNSTNFTIDVYIAGDANGDGEVNVLDAVWVGKYWHHECDHGQCDPCYGYLWDDAEEDGTDLNNDCEINVLDAVIIGANWRHVAW